MELILTGVIRKNIAASVSGIVYDPLMTSPVRGTLARYGLAAGAVVAVSLLRLPLLYLNWPDAPYLLFAIAVLVAAGFGGFGPGLLAVSLSVVAGNFFFALPYFRFDFRTPAQQARAVAFVIDGIFISILGGRLRTVRQREAAAAREARTLQAEILQIAERERSRFGHDPRNGERPGRMRFRHVFMRIPLLRMGIRLHVRRGKWLYRLA